MKLVVLGIPGLVPELLFGSEQHDGAAAFLEAGAFGFVHGVVPATAATAWLGFATGLDPGRLGVYGDEDRRDRATDRLERVTGPPPGVATLAQACERAGLDVFEDGVPPAAAGPGETGGAEAARDAAVAALDAGLDLIERHLEGDAPRLVHVVSRGLRRLQELCFSSLDPEHPGHDPASPHASYIPEVYARLSEGLGRAARWAGPDTAILLLSEGAFRSLERRFRINEWLQREGLLATARRPEAPCRPSMAGLDPARTSAWAAGGDDARIYLRVEGRDPGGILKPGESLAFRDDLADRLGRIADDAGRPLRATVVKPEAAYEALNGVAPDLIVTFDDHACEVDDTVGHAGACFESGAAAARDGTVDAPGTFVLLAPSTPLRGEIEGVHLLDLAATLEEIAGLEPSLPGWSLLSGPREGARRGRSEEDIVRRRLEGLGYI